MKQADIIIIGAGIAGLTCAASLARAGKKIIILEARDRTGGRIHTIHNTSFSLPIEEGAEFIHGDLPLTKQLLEKAGIKYDSLSGQVWQAKNDQLHQQEEFIEDGELIAQKLDQLTEDMPIATFLNTFLGDDQYTHIRENIKRFVEGYDAADIERASAMAFAKEMMDSDEDDQSRPQGGYSRLIHYVEQQCRNASCELILSKPVSKVIWTRGHVQVETKDSEIYDANQVIITVPLGILQAQETTPNAITFSPALPEKLQAAKNIGFGHVIKFSLEFNTPFWHDALPGKDLSRLGFLFSDAIVPTWWTLLPRQSNILTGWLAGPAARNYAEATKERLLTYAIQSLASIFNIDELTLGQNLKIASITNWAKDPFTLGAYAYTTVDGDNARKTLSLPVENTIFFAGEGTYIGDHTGTVEAAISSAETVSKMILATIPSTVFN